MKFIIFIADTIRHGNFPRVDQFEYSPEHGLYLYLGRELTAAEFNEACERIYHPDFRDQGFLFRPKAVNAVIQPAPVPVKNPKVEVLPVAPSAHSAEVPDIAASQEDSGIQAGNPQFRFDGKGIFIGQERVAGLFGEAKHLRVVSAHEALRPEIEAWLKTQS